MICCSGADTPLVNLEKEEELHQLAGGLSLPEICRVVNSIETGLDQLDRNANTRLLGEVLLLDWPRL
jgi:hypothetical protein